MDRLAEYALRSEDVQATFSADNNIYNMFKQNIDNVNQIKSNQFTFYSCQTVVGVIYVKLTNSIYLLVLWNKLVQRASRAEFKNVLDLMAAFLKFSLRCYSSNSDYVNQILKSCVTICQK